MYKGIAAILLTALLETVCFASTSDESKPEQKKPQLKIPDTKIELSNDRNRQSQVEVKLPKKGIGVEVRIKF